MNEYNFSDKEHAYIMARLEVMTRLNQEMKGAIDMVLIQNGLDGNWDMKPDNSGITRRGVQPSA